MTAPIRADGRYFAGQRERPDYPHTKLRCRRHIYSARSAGQLDYQCPFIEGRKDLTRQHGCRNGIENGIEMSRGNVIYIMREK